MPREISNPLIEFCSSMNNRGELTNSQIFLLLSIYTLCYNKKVMPLNKVVKDKVIKKYATCEGDTGSPEVQIALITERITQLVEHIKSNKKDQSSRRGLLILVGQRRRLLNYLGRVDAKRYATLTASLGLK